MDRVYAINFDLEALDHEYDDSHTCDLRRLEIMREIHTLMDEQDVLLGRLDPEEYPL
jgi:hypothetical protein